MSAGAILLLSLAPLSIAAGVDLYLTLVFLGSAAQLGWTAPPGALGDLSVPGVISVAALLYVVEVWIEGRPLPSLLWNALHTVVRPLAGGLLALLLLSDLPPSSRWAGAVAAAALTLGAHLVRSGWGLLLVLVEARSRARVLVRIGEDVGVLALLSLLLDAPAAALGLAAFLMAAAAVGGHSAASAFAFALRSLWDSPRALVDTGRWQGPEHFPRWVRGSLADPAFAPGGGLRGSRAGAVHLPGLGLFRQGWVVTRGGSPLFLHRGRRRSGSVDLGAASPLGVTAVPLHTRVDLGYDEGRVGAVYFGPGGPRSEDLEAEFRP